MPAYLRHIRLINHASVCDTFGVPSGLMKRQSGFRPSTLGAIRSRYSMSIRAMCGGMSNSIGRLFLTSSAGMESVDTASLPS